MPYKVVMLGTDPSLPPSLRIPLPYRLDVRSASDEEALHAVARLIHAYIDSLRFGKGDTHRTRGSPYDLFLEKNQLPTEPAQGESGLDYARRLLTLIERRKHLTWVTPEEDGEFELHTHAYQFGEMELAGLRIFFNSSQGNCVACHTPPQFTDHRFHNNGVSQSEYDALFGAGAFAALDVPDLVTRNARLDAYLPASRQHPDATSRFRSEPSKERPGFADLGVWNIFANPDFPKPQAALTQILCARNTLAGTSCTPESILPFTIALFKTPSIRDLGHSESYFHSGTAETIEDVLQFYVHASTLARSGRLRNGSRELSHMRFDENEIGLLAAFLRSLDEDYH